MTLTIDTEAKTVKVFQQVTIKELTDELKNLFPKDWKDYKLESQEFIITYPTYPVYPTPYERPYYLDLTKVTCDNNSRDIW